MRRNIHRHGLLQLFHIGGIAAVGVGGAVIALGNSQLLTNVTAKILVSHDKLPGAGVFKTETAHKNTLAHIVGSPLVAMWRHGHLTKFLGYPI